MATLARKGDVYHLRFRYSGRSYRRTLKTSNLGDAESAFHLVQRTLHRLLTGDLQFSPGVDRGDFILSGGTLRATAVLKNVSIRELTKQYLEAEERRISDTFLATK